jgi:hypothetical protein
LGSLIGSIPLIFAGFLVFGNLIILQAYA